MNARSRIARPRPISARTGRLAALWDSVGVDLGGGAAAGVDREKARSRSRIVTDTRDGVVDQLVIDAAVENARLVGHRIPAAAHIGGFIVGDDVVDHLD